MQNIVQIAKLDIAKYVERLFQEAQERKRDFVRKVVRENGKRNNPISEKKSIQKKSEKKYQRLV
jgi:hypothetical protein